MNTPPAPARDLYTLTADQAHDLHRAATPWHPGSQARMDPVYRDSLNNWWAATGLELGFKWTTVNDLWFLSASQDRYNPVPDDVVVCGATFTAEPEVAEVPDDREAHAWFLARQRARNTATPNDWMPEVIGAAFAAGRDKGFAMGSATVDALEQQLAEVRADGVGLSSAAGTPHKFVTSDPRFDPAQTIRVNGFWFEPRNVAKARVSGWMTEGQALLREAAAMFRAYEQHHQTKLDLMLRGPRGATEHGELLGKVRRNAVMAARLESYLEAFNVRWEAVGDPRTREQKLKDTIRSGRCVAIPLEESQPITQADVDRLTDAARKGPKLTGDHMTIRRDAYFDRLNRMVDESAPKVIGWDLASKPDMHWSGTGRVVGFDSRTGDVQVEFDEEDEDEAAPISPRGFTHAGEEAQRFSSNHPGFDPRQFVTVNGFMFTPQAELETLRQLLADAMPAITFVNGLATIEDADLDTFAVAQLRNQARGALGDDGFKRPGTYTDADLLRAVDTIRDRWADRVIDTPRELASFIRAIAGSLGLRRAS